VRNERNHKNGTSRRSRIEEFTTEFFVSSQKVISFYVKWLKKPVTTN
jgi:hypothetical protein